MGDFYNPSVSRKARKPHRCTYCGEGISIGEIYTHQHGNHDGRWFESKMHPECFEDAFADGGNEYTLYGNERPEKGGT